MENRKRMLPRKIGAMEVHAAVDYVGPAAKPGDMLLHANELSTASMHPSLIHPTDGRLVLAYQSFIIRYPSVTILVDAGIGEDKSYPSRPDFHERKSDWLNHLGLSGVSRDDIDIVFLTHLHMDHTGWLTRRDQHGWEPTFPRARHLVSNVELEHWLEFRSMPFMSSSIADNVLPVREARLFEFAVAGQEIAPDLFVVDLAGHSPGMLGLEYRPAAKILAAFTADLMHHPLQALAPQCSTRFCTSPEKAASVRADKLKQYADQEALVFCGHLPGEFTACRVVASGAGFSMSPAQ